MDLSQSYLVKKMISMLPRIAVKSFLIMKETWSNNGGDLSISSTTIVGVGITIVMITRPLKPARVGGSTFVGPPGPK